MDSNTPEDTGLDVDEEILCTLVQKEMNSSSLHHMEVKNMKKLFHIKM